jgi:hypothetical protein
MFRQKKNVNPKILVYIKQEPIDTVVERRVEPSSDGLKSWVVIEPQTEEKAGWKIDVTGCIRPSKRGLYVEAIRGQTRAIKIDVANNLFKDEPLTIDQYQEFINQKVFKAHYGKLLGDLLSAIKPYLIIVAILVLIAVALTGYNTYSISKIPAYVVTVTPTPTLPGVIG